MEAAVYSSLMSKVTSFSKVGDWKGVAGPAMLAVTVAIANRADHVREGGLEEEARPGRGAKGTLLYEITAKTLAK